MRRYTLRKRIEKYRMQQSSRDATTTAPIAEVDDDLGRDDVETTRPSEAQGSREISRDATTLDPSLVSAFPPPVASMLSHHACGQREVEASHNTTDPRSDAASPAAYADPEDASSARQSERGESAAEQFEQGATAAEQSNSHTEDGEARPSLVVRLPIPVAANGLSRVCLLITTSWLTRSRLDILGA